MQSCISVIGLLILSVHYCCAIRPNVVLIIVDDLRPALGCYGYPKVKSPNIDQLASQSMLFKNAHVQQAVCGPSRTSFLTSRRPDTTRLYDFGSYWRTFSGNYTTLPQHFKEHGYFAYGIGKVFHPGICSNGTDDYPYSWSQPVYLPTTTSFQRDCPNRDGSLGFNLLCPVDVAKQRQQTLPDIQSTEHAVEMLKKLSISKEKQPFFLAVGFHKPHVPYRFPKDFLNLYPISEIDLASNPIVPPKLPTVAFSPWTPLLIRDDIKQLNLSFPFGPIPDYFQRKIRQHYYSSMSYTDSLIGKVLNQLEKSGFANDTIIALIGDHGWSLGEHGEFCKWENLEPVTRVPFLVHVPDVTSGNNKKKFPFIDPFIKHKKEHFSESLQSDALVELVDLFPTLAELAGLPVPEICPVKSFKVELCTEGLSFAPLLKHKLKHGDNWKNAVFSQYPRPSDFPQPNSFMPDLKDIKIMGYSMRTKLYRYTEWVGFNPKTFFADFTEVHAHELYIHTIDPNEDNNVADEEEYQDLVAELRKRLIAGWRHALPK